MKFKSYSQQIEYILKNFDFKYVCNTMSLLDWNWINSKNERYIPTLKQLKEHAKKMLNEVIQEKHQNYWKISCGGFETTKHDKCLSLCFVITDKYGYDDIV